MPPKTPKTDRRHEPPDVPWSTFGPLGWSALSPTAEPSRSPPWAQDRESLWGQTAEVLPSDPVAPSGAPGYPRSSESMDTVTDNVRSALRNLGFTTKHVNLVVEAILADNPPPTFEAFMARALSGGR